MTGPGGPVGGAAAGPAARLVAPGQHELANVIAAIPDAVVVVDGAGLVRYVNTAARTLLSDPDGALVGQQLSFAVSPGRVAEIELIHNGRPRIAELRVVDCTWDGQPAMLAMMRDVDEQARLESELLTERALGERRLRDALDAATGPILLIDGEQRIVLANRATETLFGYGRAELEGRRLTRVLPEVAALAELEQLYRDRGRLTARRIDGTDLPVEIGLTHFDELGGSVVMLTLQDVTILREQEDSLKQQNDELSRLNQELTQFAYGVSHDLKAPLTTLTGLLEFCVEDLDAGDEASCRENLSNALETCRRNASKIEAVLRIARAGHDPVTVSPVDLRQELASIWSDLSGSIKPRPQLDIALDGAPVFRTERQTLSIILENLISNALRFRDPGKPRQWVAVRGRVANGWLDLEVADNGIGIPDSHRARIFDMFVRMSQASGSGLGLALVKKHVERLSGQITFDSDAGGTRFRVRLPEAGAG